jgi:hypothetical protein
MTTNKTPKVKPKTPTKPKPSKRGSTIYWPEDLLKAAKIRGIELDRDLSDITCEAVRDWLARHKGD